MEFGVGSGREGEVLVDVAVVIWSRMMDDHGHDHGPRRTDEVETRMKSRPPLCSEGMDEVMLVTK